MRLDQLQNPPGSQLRTEAEAREAIRQNKAERSRKAKRGWTTRRRNSVALDRMIADAVARDSR
jgi:hypothetical protein